MAIDVLDSMSTIFGTQMTRQVSTIMGDSETSTSAGLRSGAAALLAALVHKTNLAGGANEIHRAVTDESVDASLPTRLASLLTNRGSLDSALTKGGSVVGSILGNRSGGVATALSEVAGIKLSSAVGLLAIAAPMLLSVLKRFVTQGGLDAGGLGSLLQKQGSSLQRAGLDSRITNAMGFGDLRSMLPTSEPLHPQDAETPARAAPSAVTYTSRIDDGSRGRRWLPWAIAAALALIAVVFLSTRFGARPGAQNAATSLPASVYFDVGQAALNENGRKTIVAVASSAKASDAPLAVVGYSDPSGNPERNMALAQDRATAVRDALVREGVQESQVQTIAPSSVTGTGSPDDARRVEIRLATASTDTLR